MGKASKAKIFTDINHLKKSLPEKQNIIVCSGGFDPIHIGHIRYIQDSSSIDLNSYLLVIVNSDRWLKRKKGFIFMPQEERAEIAASISGVDYVLIYDDGTDFVSSALLKLQPYAFSKGGDRNSRENIPEFTLCETLGIKVFIGVGGDKINSSSKLVSDVLNEGKDESNY